jgi:hypothetical protein
MMVGGGMMMMLNNVFSLLPVSSINIAEVEFSI